MASWGENGIDREYIDIHPKIFVKCKTSQNKDYIKDNIYEAVATKQVESSAYSGYWVMKDGKRCMLLTIEHLMTTFMVVS